MRRRLEQFYAAFGDRGIMFILYAFSVVVNSLLSWNMELPAVYPDEISVAGTAAFYSGNGKWQLLGQTDGGGYVQALFYAPLYLVLDNPYALYKAMLIVNALLISFIPMIIYHLAAKLGVARVRQKLIIAISCGMYISYIANSKFIWNETVTAVMCWLLVLCYFIAWDKRGKGSRFSSSVLLGFMSALAYAANEKLIASVIALVITVVIAQLFVKEKIVNLPVFFVALVISFVGEYFVRESVSSAMGIGAEVSSKVAVNSGGSFFGIFFSQIYLFMTSTLGISALAAAVSVIMLLNLIREGTRKHMDTPESNTKVYEPIKHKYSLRLTMFALFELLSVLCAVVFSALFDSPGSADAFGRFTDNLAAPAMFLVFVFVFLYGIDLTKLILGIGIYTYACICFGAVGYPMASRLGSTGAVSINGLISIGLLAADNTAGNMTYIIMSSCVYTVFALLFVFVSCSRKHRTMLVTLSSFLIIAAVTVYLGGYRLPQEGIRNSAEIEPFCDVADLLYNDSQSPPIIVYETDPRLASTIQFMAPDVQVRMLASGEKAPESCLMIAENGVLIPFEGGSYDNVGKTDKYTVYAFGESAREFIRYSSSKS